MGCLFNVGIIGGIIGAIIFAVVSFVNFEMHPINLIIAAFYIYTVFVLINLYMMKKWALIQFTVIFVINIVLGIIVGMANPLILGQMIGSSIFPIIILIYGWKNVEWMEKPKISEITEDMVLVEGGKFQMGDTWGDGAPNETVHEVTLTYDYYIGKHEVTFREYDEYCEDTGKSKPDDEGWGRGKHPVINVSWYDAIEYCNWLSEKEGLPKAYDEKGNLLDKYGNVTTHITIVQGYRLPTEAEWEFAARGGNESKGYKYAGSNDPDEVAWYCANSGKERINAEDYYANEGKWEKFGTGDSAYYAIDFISEYIKAIYNNNNRAHKVEQKLPNELGIYDMIGNVWEWCYDWYEINYYERSQKTNPYNLKKETYRVLRGGSCFNSVNCVRVAYRNGGDPDCTYYSDCFRICRTAY